MEARDNESPFFDGAYNNAVYECVGIKRRARHATSWYIELC